MHNPLESPVPNDPIQRIRALALDLAYGAVNNFWSAEWLVVAYGGGHEDWVDTGTGGDFTVLFGKWKEQLPHISLLISLGYLEILEKTESGNPRYLLTPRAFALLEQPAPASIFISYSRRESSAFALLLVARLKAALGLDPFLDMSITPGDDWRELLETKVRSSEYVISLVGPATLESVYVRQEISWAMDAGAHVFPVWHNGFGDDDLSQIQAQHPALMPFFRRQAIRVEQENPVAYEAAIIQLLNKFGFMPA